MGYLKKVVIGAATLYHGDCLEIMPALRPVPLVVTDPPYLLTSGGITPHGMSGKFSPSEYKNNGKIVETPIEWDEFMLPLFRVMKEGDAYFMCNNRHVQAVLNEGEKAGFKFHNLLVWDKITATPNRWYMKNCEFTCFLYKGKAKRINDCGSRQLVRVPNILGAPHPTQKPVPLMQYYIENSSQLGDVVLDPFMGSGSTGVAALASGRQFIGIEINKKNFDIAVRRITEERGQKNLFFAAPEGLPGFFEKRDGVA